MRICQFLRLLFPVLLLTAFAPSVASAAAPGAPTNLKVTALGVNSFRLEWKDNATDELGYQIRVGLKSSTHKAPPVFSSIGVSSLTVIGSVTSTVITTNILTGKELDFQILAYNGLPKFEVFSKPSAIVTTRALTVSRFSAPTKLKVTPIDDAGLRIQWQDNATSETGYQIEFKKGAAKKWTVLATLGPDTKFKIPYTGLTPATSYSFRVRAYKLNPVVFTSYSNVATASTKTFQAPSDLTATPTGEGAFELKWKDNSSLETGVEIEAKTGTEPFARILRQNGSAFTKGVLTEFLLDTDYQFRLRGFRTVDGKDVFTDYSNIFFARSGSMVAPTNLAVALENNTNGALTWKNTSVYVGGYEVQYREVGGTDFVTTTTYSTALSYKVEGFPPNKTFEVRIRGISLFSASKSAYTDIARVTTKDSITSGKNPLIVAGVGFRYGVLVSRPDQLTNLAVSGLPAGLTFDQATGTITGKLTTGGTYTVTITATFADGSTNVRSLTLKSVGQSPVASQAFTAVNVAAAASKTVSVTGKFSDPDTASAARVNTTLGTFDIILFPDATPFTVENFINYIDDLRYNDTFFHRAPQNFVVQGGGYKYTEAGGFSRVPTDASVVNEPGLSNVRGTVAMAKFGNDPNSATSQFFINLGNNSGAPPLGLDFQNGGFTVFGRVPTSGMAVLDSINALPKGDYTDPTNPLGVLEDVPMNAASAPATLDSSKLVKVTSVGAAPILTYTVNSTNPAIATATLNGTDITITGAATGSTTIQVKATDLDGNNVTQNIAVTVP